MTETSSKTTLLQHMRIKALSFLGYLVYAALRSTIKWDIQEIEKIRDLDPSDGSPIILAFWHNQQIVMPKIWEIINHKKSSDLFVMISQHGDGRIIAGVIRYAGIKSIDGSSSRGGKEALAGAIRKLQSGSSIAITPDGPRGPIYRSKAGVVKASQMSGVPITPSALSADKKWTFSSWDKMFLPKPFSTVKLAIGEQIHVPKELSEEEFNAYLLKVDDALNEVTKRCEDNES